MRQEGSAGHFIDSATAIPFQLQVHTDYSNYPSFVFIRLYFHDDTPFNYIGRTTDFTTVGFTLMVDSIMGYNP